MKQQWQQIESKIDALNLRERAMAFAAAALVLIALVNSLLLDPLLEKQKLLSQRVKLEQQQIAAIQADIQLRVQSHDLDPDAPNRARLQSSQQQSAKMRNELAAMQNGLVPPDKMASLLEDLLKRNGKLQLASLKTLPVTALNSAAGAESGSVSHTQAAAGGTSSRNDEAKIMGESVYKHGVELVVQGGYPDLLKYLEQLEAMPWRLFWAKAKLNVDEYPRASLTLTLFTLSSDKKWLHI